MAGEPRLIDVLGLGIVTIDDLLYVDSYPEADAKVPVLRRERHCGGLTGTALVAAARLGSRCAYGGVLGTDADSDFVADRLQAEGVDVGRAARREGAGPILSTIIIGDGGRTRAIFFDRGRAVGPDDDWPDVELIRSARVLFVDHLGVEGMIRAARIAREAGIPVVADFERDESPRFAELLALTDHLIVNRAFAAKLTGEADPHRAAAALWSDRRAAVIVTCGEEGCWYIDGPTEGSIRHGPAFAIEVVDTTGCGDVFHGAYASALARGLEISDRVRLASAAAALKATRPGGQAGIPTMAAVEAFLKGRGR